MSHKKPGYRKRCMEIGFSHVKKRASVLFVEIQVIFTVLFWGVASKNAVFPFPEKK